jgi:hypothetical protein
MFEKTQSEVLQEMNNRQKDMQREENYRAERAEKQARYNALSQHEKKYYHEPNELAFRFLVEAYQKDEYSLSKSVEFAYNDYIGDYDDAVTPREKRIAAARKKIATDYRNAHFFPLVHKSFKKRVNRLLSKKELTEKEVHAEILQEYSVSEDEFKQKFSEKFSRAIELAEKNFKKDSVTILRDVLHFGIFQRMNFLLKYSKTYKRNWIIKGIIIFLIFGVAPLTFLGYDSLNGSNFNEKLANITGKGTYDYYKIHGIYKDKYVGEVLDSQRHGQGTYIWENGDKFIGEWQKGNIVKGTYNFANGDEFVGEFFDNEKISYNWTKDREDVSIKTGKGSRTKDETQYSGDWENGAWHGQGTVTTEKGTIITGGFKEGNFHGDVFLRYDGEETSTKFKFINGERIE